MADTPRTIGPYEILGELGRGGMGVVYRARQPGLDREVAIKVLLGGAHSDDAARERFLREAKATAQLRHPHIVAVYDTGFEGELPWIAMDFIPGKSLDDAIGAEQVDVERAVEITRQIAEALHHAHEAGIIHRDVKPANVLLDASGNAYLTDFGLARQVEDASGLTASGAILGTPAYMAPEQARAEAAVDARADVYGLGAMLYEMLVGRPPFEGDTPIQTLTRVLHDDPTPPRRLAPKVSHQLELVCLTAIAKEPARRYQSGAALAEDCRRVAAGEPIAARAPGLGYRLRRGLRRHRVLAIASLLAAAATAAGVYLLAIRPAQQARAADLALLDGALQQRRTLVAEFSTALAAGDHDAAIAKGLPAHATTPAIPRVRDAALAELPAYAELATPIALDLAAAYLARGRARLAKQDELGRHDLVTAFRLGRTGTLGRDAARDALLGLALYFERAGAHQEAERTARLCAATFGTDVPAVRALLGRTRARAGHVEEAAQWWHSLRDDPDHGTDAQHRLVVLEALSPARSVPGLSGRIIQGDLDGDGSAELLHINRSWVLRRRTPAPPWTQLGDEVEVPKRMEKSDPGLVKLLDLDGDGRTELLVSGGAWGRGGRIVVLGWRDGALALLGHADLTTTATDATLADLDHDGTKELVVAVDWHERGLRVFRFDTTGLTELYRWPMMCDPHFVHGLPDGRLLLGLGPWVAKAPPVVWAVGRTGIFRDDAAPDPNAERPWAYRLIVLGDGGTGRYREVAAATERIGRSRICWLSEDTFVVAAGAGLSMAKLIPNRVRGLLRYTVTADGLSEPVRLDADWGDSDLVELPVVWNLPSGPHVAVCAHDDLHIAPADGGPGLKIENVGGRRAVVVQADDDDTPELTVELRRDSLVAVYGEGAFVPGPVPTVQADAAGTSGEPVPPEQELLEAGLYDEVIVACRERLARAADPATSFRLGVACAARQQWPAAAAAFKDAAVDRLRAVDALMRRAHALEELRDWPALADCLTLLGDTAGVDPLAAELAAAKGPSAREAAGIAPRLEWNAGAPLDHFFCDNPLKTRLGPGGLVCWSSSEETGETAGQFLRYEGGPLRAVFRFSTDEVRWATSVRVGFQHVNTLGRRGWSVGGPTIEFVVTAAGARDRPVYRAELRGVAAEGGSRRHRLPEDRWTPEPGTEYEVTIELLPTLGRAWCDVRAAASGERVAHLRLRPPGNWPKGDYLIGRTAWRRASPENGEDVTRSTIAGVQLAGTPTLRAGTPGKIGHYARLGMANGLLASGKTEAAAAAYRRFPLAEVPADDTILRARYHLFRALALHRLGRDQTAQEQIAAAAQANAKYASRLLMEEAPGALGAAERAWMRNALQAARGR